MKYAFYPGCVARGAAPELFIATMAVADKLNLELVEINKAACTGAGVLQEKNRLLGDILNVRTLAIAEQMQLPLMTICSTCQGVLSQAHHRVKQNDKYMAEVNSYLKDENLEYKGTTVIKHLMWVLLEDIGAEKLSSAFVLKLPNLKLAPFYGCYIVRPSDALELDQNPSRRTALEELIERAGAEVVDFKGKTACCGFPILFINQKNSLKMVSNHTGTARDKGADAMITPCPLCHLNLDGYQAKAWKDNNRKDKSADLPIIHLPQFIAILLGVPIKEIGLSRHFVSTSEFIKMIEESSVSSSA